MLYNTLTPFKARSLSTGKYADGQGLWLWKRTKLAGQWVLRLRVAGARREMGLGRWPDVTIAEARERAAEARRQVRDGADPIAERQAARHRPHRLTVKEAIDDCFKSRKAELKGEGEAGRWLSPLKVHIIPKLGKVAIEDIDQHRLKAVLEPIWHEKTEAAVKALNRMSLTLKHAAALGLDVDLQATMKTRALLGKQRHSVSHIPALPYQEAPAFYKSLTTTEGVSALALRFLMLTVARTSEVRLATFAEIEGDIWTLPPDRTKTNREHRIPLTDEAKRIVDECRKRSPNEYLFPAYKGQPISDAAMATLMKRQGMAARPHGFRATFRTWCEECTDTSFEVKEAALGHAVDVGVVGAYQRSDRLGKRTMLISTWAEWLTTGAEA
ncbi:MAG: integrase arm-type DNA-binding domain-containing protein [Burkholderiales bacterium]